MFNEWRNSIPDLAGLKVNRWIKYSQGRKMEVHLFADAAMSAYGCLAYTKVEDEEGNFHVTLMKASCRIFPKNEKNSGLHGSVPRREMVALVAAVEMKLVLDVTLVGLEYDCFIWTDSSSCLFWLNNETLKLDTWVANRVTKVLAAAGGAQIAHVAGVSNPADLLTRGIEANDREKWAFFFKGPEWLHGPKEGYPSTVSAAPPTEDRVECHAANVNVDVMLEDDDRLFGMVKRSSTFDSIVRKLILIRRFVWFCRRRKSPSVYKGERETLYQHASRETEVTNQAPSKERERAEAVTILFKWLQHRHFPKEIKSLTEGKGRVVKKSRLRDLCPVLDSRGLCRVGGRLGESFVNAHPVILPREPHVVAKLLAKMHRENGHVGAASLHHLVRQKFWILQGGAACRSCTRSCMRCKKNFAPLAGQLMANLPSARTAPSYPFEETGVDLCGPFLLRGRQNKYCVKRWIVLITCLKSRAVHLEVAESLEASAFILALARFHARRQAVRRMWSDNGTNFVGANRLLKVTLSNWNKESERYLERKGL